MIFWSMLTFRGKAWVIGIGVSLILIAAIIFYIFFLQNQVEVEKQRGIEAIAEQGQIQVDKQKEEVNKTTNVADKSLENVNAVEKENFSNTNLDAANKARCKAFPNSKECK